MTKPIPSVLLTAARLEAAFSVAATSTQKAAGSMEAFAFLAHMAFDTDEYQQGVEVATAALAVAARKSTAS